jgi:hypothetical protein
MEKFKKYLPIKLVIFYTALMLFASYKVKTAGIFNVSKNAYINFQFNYQIILLIITAMRLAPHLLIK